MSVTSETCVRGEKIIKILSSAFCLKKPLKVKIGKARILEKKKLVPFWFDWSPHSSVQSFSIFANVRNN